MGSYRVRTATNSLAHTSVAAGARAYMGNATSRSPTEEFQCVFNIAQGTLRARRVRACRN